MSAALYLTPAEITGATLENGVKKAGYPWQRTVILAFLAGAFIAFASEGSNMAAFNLLARADTYGLGKCLAGAIFGTGLMLVVLAGGELFTGNTMLVGALAVRRIRLRDLLRNWFLVYAGNLAGSLFVAWLMVESGLFHSGANLLGGITIKIAAYKTGLDFGPALALGLLCNWLVCLAIWLATGARDMAGKILGIFFPIWLFITSGFEHSVANMYYIPAGLLAAGHPEWLEAARAAGTTQAALEGLTWANFFLRNLLPVTLGNILGGGGLVMLAYWLAYGRPRGSSPSSPEHQ